MVDVNDIAGIRVGRCEIAYTEGAALPWSVSHDWIGTMDRFASYDDALAYLGLGDPRDR